MKKSPNLIIILFLIFLSVGSKAQTTGKILLICDADADVLLDGDKQGSTTAGNAFKIEASAGDHYVQVQATQNGKLVNIGKTVTIEAGKQVIINLSLANATPVAVLTSTNSDTTLISNVDFIIDGGIVVGSWMVDNPDQDYPNYPVHYYVLDKNDQLIIDFKMDNKKGTNVIQVASYPDGNVIYQDNNLVSAKNLSIKIPAKGIYSISFATNHLIDRSCNMRVRKIAGSPESKNLSSAVGWETKTDTIFKWVTDTIVTVTHKAVELQTPLKQWVNSGSNAFFKDGKSRLTIQIDLPKNTIEWYYIVAADRDEASMSRTLSTFNLLTDITTAIDATGVAGFAVSMLTAPPGANYCDVVLLSAANQTPFLNHEEYNYIQEGTRFNVVSGLVKIKGYTQGRYYLGFRNPDSTYGEFVSIEVVAVTKEVTRKAQRRKKVVSITTKKFPVMNN